MVSLAVPAIVARLSAAGCVFADDEAQLLISAAQSPAELISMVDRRVAGLPLEQVIGWAEFCGLRIAVDPGVFVPRRRSEFLVAQAIALARPTALVVDMCCGTGAVGVAVTSAKSDVELHAVDIDPAAVQCARRNVGAGGHVYEGDLFDALPDDVRGRIDLLIANTPYVPTAEIALLPAEARLYEALVALDGGADGLDVQRRVIAGARSWLAPGGNLLIETSERQAPYTIEAFSQAGLVSRVQRDEHLDATVVVGTN